MMPSEAVDVMTMGAEADQPKPGHPAVEGRGAYGRATLRSKLLGVAPRLGLTVRAVDEIVAHAQITYWRAEQTIRDGSSQADWVHFVMSGAVRLQFAGRKRIVFEYVPPGRLVCLPAWPDEGLEICAVAHEDAVVALVSYDVVKAVLESLPAGCRTQFGQSQWCSRFHLALERSLLARQPLQDRVLLGLRGLARRFGRPHPEGTAIDLRLAHADIADLVGGSRPNVTRCLGALRRAGLVKTTANGFVIPTRQTRASAIA